MQHFVAIGLGVSAPQMREFAVPFGVTSFSLRFIWFCNKTTTYTPERIFTQNTSNDVVPGKEVPFRKPDYYIQYLNPYIYEKPPIWRPILLPKNAFTVGCPNIYYHSSSS